MIRYDDLLWQSDWNGYEVGHDDINVIGFYSLKVNPDISFYIDVEKERIVEAFYMCEECEMKEIMEVGF
jgi:hypothetical protein